MAICGNTAGDRALTEASLGCTGPCGPAPAHQPDRWIEAVDVAWGHTVHCMSFPLGIR